MWRHNKHNYCNNIGVSEKRMNNNQFSDTSRQWDSKILVTINLKIWYVYTRLNSSNKSFGRDYFFHKLIHCNLYNLRIISSI